MEALTDRIAAISIDPPSAFENVVASCHPVFERALDRIIGDLAADPLLRHEESRIRAAELFRAVAHLDGRSAIRTIASSQGSFAAKDGAWRWKVRFEATKNVIREAQLPLGERFARRFGPDLATILHMWAAELEEYAVSLCLNEGADPHALSRSGKTPLDYARDAVQNARDAGEPLQIGWQRTIQMLTDATRC